VRCLSTALRMRSSLPIQATSATFFGLPAVRASAHRTPCDLRVVARGATRAPIYNAQPSPPISHPTLGAPTSKGTGIPIERGDAHQGGELLASARPPSSANSARSVLASTGPTPGTRRAKALRSHARSGSLRSPRRGQNRGVLSSSFSSHRTCASIRLRTGLVVAAPKRFFSEQ
jgi:hypothetical protein